MQLIRIVLGATHLFIYPHKNGVPPACAGSWGTCHLSLAMDPKSSDEKTFGFKLSASTHRLLKLTVPILGISLKEYLNDLILLELHKQASQCHITAEQLELEAIELDHRVFKSCHGYHCHVCKHRDACSAGTYLGLLEYSSEYLRRYPHLTSGQDS